MVLSRLYDAVGSTVCPSYSMPFVEDAGLFKRVNGARAYQSQVLVQRGGVAVEPRVGLPVVHPQVGVEHLRTEEGAGSG